MRTIVLTSLLLFGCSGAPFTVADQLAPDDAPPDVGSTQFPIDLPDAGAPETAQETAPDSGPPDVATTAPDVVSPPVPEASAPDASRPLCCQVPAQVDDHPCNQVAPLACAGNNWEFITISGPAGGTAQNCSSIDETQYNAACRITGSSSMLNCTGSVVYCP
jgi:hypothetical protein